MLKSYLAFTSAVHHVLTRAYERLGAAIARKPLLTILLSVAAISLANLGLLKLPPGIRRHCALYAWPLSSTMIESQQSSARAETSSAAAASTRVAQFAQLRSIVRS